MNKSFFEGKNFFLSKSFCDPILNLSFLGFQLRGLQVVLVGWLVWLAPTVTVGCQTSSSWSSSSRKVAAWYGFVHKFNVERFVGLWVEFEKRKGKGGERRKRRKRREICWPLGAVRDVYSCHSHPPPIPQGGKNFFPNWKTGKNLKNGKEKGGKEENKEKTDKTLKYLYEA